MAEGRPSWAPAEVALGQPSPARIYDYLLGGSHNLAVDRQVAEQVLASMPDGRAQARANRAFLFRAVRHLVAVGIRQFLDLGSGIPTVGNVHEVARRAAPQTRVVYVDIDPVAVAHARALLSGDPLTGVVGADVRDVEGILDSPEVGRLLDLDQPVGLLMVAILHVVPDADDPTGLVRRLRDAVPPGSYLAIGHGTADSRPENADRLTQISRRTPTPMTPRTREQIAAFFDGFTLLDPGLVWAPLWRPDPGDDIDHPEQAANYGGVGYRP